MHELFRGRQVAASADGKISTSTGEMEVDSCPDGASEKNDAAEMTMPRMMVFIVIPPCCDDTSV
jgi:hypothetical protein